MVKRTVSGVVKAFKDYSGGFSDLVEMEVDTEVPTPFSSGYSWKSGCKCIVGGVRLVEQG